MDSISVSEVLMIASADDQWKHILKITLSIIGLDNGKYSDLVRF